jgi:FtsP/CotA-like multicopper oxidase with cupredoxin domain
MRSRSLVLASVTALLLGGGGSARPAPTPFANPPEIRSSGGVLDATLTIGPATVEVARKTVALNLYNGLYMPPVLRVQPGDRIRLHLQNGGPFGANIHYHGFQVTPLAPGDNIFLDTPPGGSYDYDFTLPADHPPGLYCYHPHVHPGVNKDIAGGLSGGLVVGDVLGTLGLGGLTERFLLLKDLKFEKGQVVVDPDPDGPTRRTVNGLWRPRLEMAPGELQFWRIGNVGANIYYRLRLDGFRFMIVAQDGNVKNQIVETRELLIPPAARYEVLVQAPRRRGTHRLRALHFKTGPGGDAYPPQVLASVRVAGARVTAPPLPSMPVVADLRDQSLTGMQRRTVTFADDPNDPNRFLIDDKVYDHDRIDQPVTLGSLEEWTIVNTANELHAFHIHQTDFQVISVNGVEQAFSGYQDTVNLPAATRKGGPSQVVVRIPFTNPVMVGKFVFHCHIVQHADQGMMANIEVAAP